MWKVAQGAEQSNMDMDRFEMLKREQNYFAALSDDPVEPGSFSLVLADVLLTSTHRQIHGPRREI